MGKKEGFSLDGGSPTPSSSWFGLGSISSAIQTITGSKWAEGAVRRAPRQGSDEPLQYRTDPIPWKEVEAHASAESCWTVVKSKVSLLERVVAYCAAVL